MQLFLKANKPMAEKPYALILLIRKCSCFLPCYNLHNCLRNANWMCPNNDDYKDFKQGQINVQRWTFGGFQSAHQAGCLYSWSVSFLSMNIWYFSRPRRLFHLLASGWDPRELPDWTIFGWPVLTFSPPCMTDTTLLYKREMSFMSFIYTYYNHTV